MVIANSLLCSHTQIILASHLLISESLQKFVVVRTSREGIDMVYVFAIIASGLLATIAYLVVTWIWDE
jgi:hypothetical protein